MAQHVDLGGDQLGRAAPTSSLIGSRRRRCLTGGPPRRRASTTPRSLATPSGAPRLPSTP
eukprot:7710460-Pyramimonas_sp.AAC.1